MKQRLLDMAEQRNFLCDQLKALLKRNKVLEAEIYQLKNGGDLHSLSVSMGSASFFRSHHSQKGHDDHSSAISQRQGNKKTVTQLQQPGGGKGQLQNQLQSAGMNNNYSSKVRFDPVSTTHSEANQHKDDDDDDEDDPMMFMDEEDEDAEFAFLQQQMRTQKLRQSRQESALRLSVSLDNGGISEGEDDDDSPKGRFSRYSSSNRFAQLPAPLQRAVASGRGDSLFNVQPTNSNPNNNNPGSRSPSPPLRSSQSAMSLSAPRAAATMNVAMNNGQRPSSSQGQGISLSHSMPVLPSLVNHKGYHPPQQHAISQEELRRQQQEHYKAIYEQMVTGRSPLELSLEDALRDIFADVRRRKKQGSMLCSTKRPTSVAFSEGINGNAPKSASPSNRNPWANGNDSSRGLSPGMQDIVDELDAQEDDILPEPGSDGARLIKMMPNIMQRGGIAGLGTAQFIENDRFAAMVKFLAKPEVFERVTDRLYTLYFPPTEEELRASGQYLGKRGRSASPSGRR